MRYAPLLYKKIIAATLYATQTPLFKDTKFDHVIIDETSRSLISTTLCSLFFGQKSFILAGDYHQLQPIIPSSVDDKTRETVGKSLLAYYLENNSKVGKERIVCLKKIYRTEEKELYEIPKVFYKSKKY